MTRIMGILFYGWTFPAEHIFPWQDDQWYSNDFMDWWAHLTGFIPGNIGNDSDYAGWAGHLERNPPPLEFIGYCSDPERWRHALIIPNTYHHHDGADHLILYPETLVITPEQLEAAWGLIKKHGISEEEPHWYLAGEDLG